MEKAQPRWVNLSIPDKCVASTFGVHCTPVGSVGTFFGGAPLQRTRSDGQAFKPARAARRSSEFAADTAAFTVLVL